jgi:hypothetical protein
MATVEAASEDAAPAPRCEDDEAAARAPFDDDDEGMHSTQRRPLHASQKRVKPLFMHNRW